MKQIKEESELVDKTIAKVINFGPIGLIFTDGTYAVFKNDDYENVVVSSTATLYQLRSLGVITEEEIKALQAEELESTKRYAKAQRREEYLALKKEFEGEQA